MSLRGETGDVPSNQEVGQLVKARSQEMNEIRTRGKTGQQALRIE